MALVHMASLQLPERILHPFARLPDDSVLASLDLLHVDGNRAADHHAVVGAAAGDIGRAGAGHQSFGWDTAGVDAGAAEKLALDDGYFHPSACQPGRKRGAGLSRTDDDGVI